MSKKRRRVKRPFTLTLLEDFPVSRHLTSIVTVAIVCTIICFAISALDEDSVLLRDDNHVSIPSIRGKLGGRKLAQAQNNILNPLVLPLLSPLVPINFAILNGDLVSFDVDQAANANLVLLSNFLTLMAFEANLFGDFPVVQLAIPEFDLIGGLDVDVTPEGFGEVEPGAILAELASWVQGNFFDFSADWTMIKLNIFKTFGFEELGFPVGFANIFTPPFDFEGVLSVNLVEDSFISVLKKWLSGDRESEGPLRALWSIISRTFNIPPVYGIRLQGTY